MDRMDKRSGDNFEWFFGVVEDRNDPLMLARVRVRAYGVHTNDKLKLPTKDLPWAQVIMPPNSSSINDIGWDGTGLMQGTWVVGFWLDENFQQPLIMGTLHGIPQFRTTPKMGFSDPTPSAEDGNASRYPTRSHEPDTNRLSRNDPDFPPGNPISRNEGQTKRIPIANEQKNSANGEALWDEPNAKYNAKYPNNHVWQTEAGHIQEWDGTPGSERIHQYHKAGTHYEIDAAGNKQTRIVANNYVIIAGDDYVNIKGTCNLTIDTDCRTYIKGNWDIQVDGNVTENIKGTMTQTVDGTVQETYKNNQTTNITGTQKQYATSLIDADAPRIDLNKNR